MFRNSCNSSTESFNLTTGEKQILSYKHKTNSPEIQSKANITYRKVTKHVKRMCKNNRLKKKDPECYVNFSITSSSFEKEKTS